MCHALFFDDNMVVGRAIRDHSGNVGSDTRDQARSERQAIGAAEQHAPDLIVVGGTIAGGSPLDVARGLALSIQTPVTVVASDGFMPRKIASAGAGVDGPHLLNDLQATPLSGSSISGQPGRGELQ